MYYYTCKAVLTIYFAQTLLDSTDLTGHQCQCTNSTGLNRFDRASMQMDKLYWT